jgi:hypothetical protein
MRTQLALSRTRQGHLCESLNSFKTTTAIATDRRARSCACQALMLRALEGRVANSHGCVRSALLALHGVRDYRPL